MKKPLKYGLIIIGIVITILVFLLVIHYRELTRCKESLEIAQLPNDDLEKILLAKKDNTPVVIKESGSIPSLNQSALEKTKTTVETFRIKQGKIEWPDQPDLKNQSLEKAWQLYKQDKGGFIDQSIPDLLTPEQVEKLTKFRSPLCRRFQIYFSLLPKDFQSDLTRQFTHLNFYFVMTGQLSFKLYHPKYHSYLSYQGTQTGLVHHQEKWETKPTLSDQAKYIEIIARPGQVLFIPSRWISSFSCPQPTSLIHLVTTSLIVDFSAFYEKIASSNNS